MRDARLSRRENYQLLAITAGLAVTVFVAANLVRDAATIASTMPSLPEALLGAPEPWANATTERLGDMTPHHRADSAPAQWREGSRAPFPGTERDPSEAIRDWGFPDDGPLDEYFTPGDGYAGPPQSGERTTSEQTEEVRTATVAAGDSLYKMFISLGLDQQDLVLLTEGTGESLRELHPGQKLSFHVEGGRLDRVVHEVNEVDSIEFWRDAEGFKRREITLPHERRLTVASGSIDNSLFLAAQAAGLSDKTIMQLVEVFGWDIDFASDIQVGDRFTVIYEELYKDDRKVADGEVLAAEFVNTGRSVRAVRYTDPAGRTGYFSPEGESMRKAFLRMPVKFGYISSHFNLKRKHPILHTIRAHKGVDYAAPAGTPVMASGDGKVTLAARNGGYGKTVVLRHGGTYTTLYAHLSRLAKGIRPGVSVEQGQTIGYVGSTGLATGPHLHYEFRVQGVHQNPVKVELPKAASIALELKADFIEKTRSMIARLEGVSRIRLAANN